MLFREVRAARSLAGFRRIRGVATTRGGSLQPICGRFTGEQDIADMRNANVFLVSL